MAYNDYNINVGNLKLKIYEEYLTYRTYFVM